MKLEIYQIDAFASRPFTGNPAAVVPLTEWLPDEVMLNVAMENNLAETAYFVSNDGGYDLRWFTPTLEMDLCGHATLATAYLIFEILGTDTKLLRFQTRSGELTVERKDGRYVLDLPSRPGVNTDAPEGLLDAFGAVPKEILKSRDYMLVYGSEADVLAIKPDFNLLMQIDAHAVIVTAPGDNSDFVSRFFAPDLGVPEDPVTGSAHCTLIPYWAEKLGKNELFARQVSARGGELYCELVGDRVKIGGNAVLYMNGEIYVGSEKALVREIEYRLARPDESEAISELLLESFGLFEAEYTPGAFEYTTPSEEVVRGRFDEGPVWVAMDGKAMIGTVSGLPETERFYVRSMAVRPDAQGLGVGQRLLDGLEGFAREASFERIYLYTTHVLPGAKRLYEKNGFYVLRETAPEEWFDMGGLEMEKELTVSYEL